MFIERKGGILKTNMGWNSNSRNRMRLALVSKYKNDIKKNVKMLFYAAYFGEKKFGNYI